ncbi:MAG: hypothetical protein OXC79_11665 [Candidatus Poribacteria bacterium]|nr:hypothetical protein [Candidatus Poribacteria bacterium]
MKLQISFALLLLLAMVAFAGCYTQLGHHASSDFGRVHPKHYEGLAKAETGAEHAEEASELGSADTEDSEGYYGRRKRSYRTTYTQPYRYNTYGSPYVAYPYYAYPPVWYYPYRPFYRYGYYGYHAPYSRYYSGYYPYRNVYRRYHGGSRYTPLSRRTYKKGNLRLENQRSRSSRGATSRSPRSRSERLRTRDQNKK